MLPPDIFFDAKIDLKATLAANAASLVGKPAYADLMSRWRAASERDATPDGRLPFGAIASFLVDDVPAMLLAYAHLTYLIQRMNLHMQESLSWWRMMTNRQSG